ncbi:MAG TPA: branched-chain amino acid ABC transporter permease [Firmicutes bacterium]|nr:branched-chain amino acid ABC transporter permease [Bacillota bacterium]
MYTVFVQQTLNALQLGAIYALIALGYSMVYGIIRLINFAHGDIFMVGAYLGLGIALFFKPPFLVTMLLAMGLTALLGVTIERVAYRRLRYAQRMSAVITALGVGIFLENFVRAAISANPQAYPALLSPRTVTFSGISTSNVQLLIIGVSVGLMLVLRYVVRQTMLGKAMRAVSDNKEVIPLMGINLNLIVSATFAIGSALAAAGGIFYGQAYPMIDPYMGIVIGWKAFISAVMGGIGQIDGAMLGGFILGVVEVIGAAYRSTLRDGIAFAILIVVLLIKPTGLLGRPVTKKV